MVQLLNSIYLGAAKPEDYGKAAGVVELLPFDYYLGAAVPSSGVPTFDVLLSGVSPLTILNAIKLNYIKAFGKCEQASTPTPTSPVNIVANNGTLKVRHQSGLPIGYQAYEYITTNGSKWLNTGVKLASTDVIETEFKNNSTTGYGALYGVFALGQSSAFYANNTYYGYDVANDKVDTGVSVDTAWHTLRQDFSNGVITLDGNDTTYTPFEFENVSDNYLFARYYNNSYGYGFKGSCKRFKVFRNGVLICDLIPAIRLSDNAIGMYDLVQNEFRGNLGSGDFTISNQIDDPIEVYYDGTVETVSIDTTGSSATCQPLLSVGDYKDMQNITNGAITRNVGVLVLNGTENWSQSTTSQGLYRYRFEPTVAPKLDGVYGRGHCVSTHFFDIGDVSTQNIGGVFASTTFIYFIPNQDIDTLEKWTTYLTDQLAAGTPVIVVYPLATPTTETVTGQTLTITQGTNVVTAEGSVDDLELEISYKAYAEVTVEEIEAVNTDENVEVIIS